MARKTILVVDDAPEHLDLLVSLLKQKEYAVKAAVSGEIALKIAQSPHPPDLILLDILMPGIDGLEVCEILKSDPATAHIPVIFLSGMATGEDGERGMELGGAAYLKKPVEMDSLFSLLQLFIR
jgi:CheY-like chemotaxis protein